MSEACGVGPERSAESGPSRPGTTLDVSCSRAFISHGLQNHLLQDPETTLRSSLWAPGEDPSPGWLCSVSLSLCHFQDLQGLALGSSFSDYSRSCVKATIPSLT